MPSTRQLRTLVVGVIIGVVFVLFYTSHLRQHEVRDGRTLQDFYHKTVSGLDKKPAGAGSAAGAQAVIKDKDGDGNIDADDEKLAQDMADRLKEAAVKAKEAANKKAPLRPDDPSDIVGIGNSAAGQKKDAAAAGAKDVEKKQAPAKETDEEHAVEVEVNAILKKSPGMFPSPKKHAIESRTYVVELAAHPIGKALQDFLAAKTGRSTVPNVLINSVSIGGFDDVRDLDEQQKLVAKIIDLGQKKVTMVQRAAGAAGLKSS
ncbi:glutaredoxin domain-containing protein [Verticillium alfalfae VaMs.102]|uniref:Glutaredoxin domain-containing protein n=1 Tax=Verticillium alfalfae (strain VaMs.102 / ATCC MYA-4576 / FGSC 10136) TaxID=526221 RepID=C9SMN1_VERA1|nr:glutaredoxin domain-containing protein [Verticillium alfalfae VaMs.102]EEY20046.1 glutaredoxin domain-containing protein [Verticillium alfalfae VaMs.102]